MDFSSGAGSKRVMRNRLPPNGAHVWPSRQRMAAQWFTDPRSGRLQCKELSERTQIFLTQTSRFSQSFESDPISTLLMAYWRELLSLGSLHPPLYLLIWWLVQRKNEVSGEEC